jgi:lysozyme
MIFKKGLWNNKAATPEAPIAPVASPAAPAPGVAQTMSEAGLAMSKYYEGLVLVAADDGYGTPTIGYGRIKYDDGTPVKIGDTCTQTQADQWLLEDVDKDGGHYVRAWATGPLTQNQFDALADFGFNRGAGNLKTLLGMGQGPVQLAANIAVFDDVLRTTSHLLLGWQRRRRSEAAFFQGQDWTIFQSWHP